MTENAVPISAPSCNHVVRSFSIGHTSVKICDDFCQRDEEEINAILERIAQRAMEALSVKELGNMLNTI